VLHKTLIALAAAVALGCVPVATNSLAADHPANHASARHAAGGHAVGGHAMVGYAHGGHVARYGSGYRTGPIYNSCAGYSYGRCPGYGVPLVGGVINGILGGYDPY
jgi:hypothetical protein